MASLQQTRIEAYFFTGSCISPGGIHIAELLRFIIQDLPTLNAIGAGGDPMTFYADRIANAMWLHGGPPAVGVGPLRYNSFRVGGGAPGFGVHSRGGIFNLWSFLVKGYPMCNCYDLAAIIQVCCKELGRYRTQVLVGHLRYQ